MYNGKIKSGTVFCFPSAYSVRKCLQIAIESTEFLDKLPGCFQNDSETHWFLGIECQKINTMKKEFRL